MNWPKAHTWWRTIVSVVVCATAVGTYWNRTHPPQPVKYKVVQVKQGDGYVSAQQCGDIDKGAAMTDVRSKYGFPAAEGDSTNDNLTWNFPLREDHHRFCMVGWDFDHKVESVWLALK
jgi:hypothetical protein